ncbi:YdcF family protein [Rhodoplanes sp. Z2-YC6860]|uniref:YdcF family protein n=1 Tax=Rhodoplanes sp. Z2-YC6860 TaxID=674703 RepID=UPI00078E149D|nr:YdcF family protein [Rhodoplanes sp. Z2-YC6860]AMN40468.1 hypothetical protein RHPLAN_20240 [Rhodoplanes sp. Z2-YC6860]
MMRIARLLLDLFGVLALLSSILAVVLFFSIAGWLQYQDEPLAADYIVPLAGDGARLIKAAELFGAGLAPVILLSNELQPRSSEADGEGFPARDGRVAILNSLGVPKQRISHYGSNLLSTTEEAEALGAHLAKRKATVLLVTSPYQARRAKLIFERELPDVRCIVVWPLKDELQPSWWRDKNSAVLVVTEVAKVIFYFSGGVFRGAEVATAIAQPQTGQALQRSNLEF